MPDDLPVPSIEPYREALEQFLAIAELVGEEDEVTPPARRPDRSLNRLIVSAARALENAWLDIDASVLMPPVRESQAEFEALKRTPRAERGNVLGFSVVEPKVRINGQTHHPK